MRAITCRITYFNYVLSTFTHPAPDDISSGWELRASLPALNHLPNSTEVIQSMQSYGIGALTFETIIGPPGSWHE